MTQSKQVQSMLRRELKAARAEAAALRACVRRLVARQVQNDARLLKEIRLRLGKQAI